MPERGENQRESTTEQSATCPVCQMEIDVSAETARLEHNGHTFYFCDESCRDEFEAKPASFVK